MLSISDAPACRTITLDRPDHRNALTREGLDALDEAITGTDAPVISLHGAGESFCAGADLDVVAELTREEATAFAERGQAVARTIETTDSVVVAGIDGAARGGGVELALACDLRIGTPAATFAEPGVEFGLFGAWGGTVRLPRVVGEGEALDLALSGRVVDAEAALRMGLLSRIVDEPKTVARSLTDNDHRALATIKRRLRDTGSAERREQREAEAFANLVESAAFDRPSLGNRKG